MVRRFGSEIPTTRGVVCFMGPGLGTFSCCLQLYNVIYIYLYCENLGGYTFAGRVVRMYLSFIYSWSTRFFLLIFVIRFPSDMPVE